jgi:uncharacterized phage infection (PIP) family protein YhgE
MHIFLWCICASYILSIVSQIAMIGKTREASKPGTVATASILNMSIAAMAAMYASGVWK